MENQMKMANNMLEHKVHHGIKCQHFFEEPIVGYRYKCIECNNYNLCQKCEEKNSYSGLYPHDFIKIRKEEKKNNDNDFDKLIYNNDNNNINNKFDDFFKNEEEGEKKYSFEYVDPLSLVANICEGTNETKINLILKNNGHISWPNNSKLIFDKNSKIIGNEINLQPQNPGEKRNYEIKFNNLNKYPSGEYELFLRFCVNEVLYGDKITLKIKINPKNNQDDIAKYIEKIKEFRKHFSLSEENFTNERLLEVLKKNKFDFKGAFQSLFN